MDYTKKKLGVISLGCDKNRVDTEKLLGVAKGKIEITSNIDEANIVVINTCAFLNASREESIDNIFDVNSRRDNGTLEKIIVSGCLPQKFVGDIFEDFKEVDAFLGVSDYERLFEVLDEIYSGKRVNFVGDGKKEIQGDRVLTTPKSYAYLKIADGCDNFCTYCLIPKIRGRYHSVPMEQLIDEAKKLGNIPELILVAQDVTRYGEDLYKEQALPKLIRELTALDNIGSVRLLYAYPDKLNDEIIDEIANNDKVIKYIDIPLQHASNEVLKRMNRKGSREQYLALMKKLRERVKGIAIRSTFITGFPNESKEDFESVIDFIKEVKFNNAGFFAYSREEDTPAYKFENQIKESEKLKRVKKLYEVQREISNDVTGSYVGKTLNVIVDGYDEETLCYKGRAYFNAPEIDGVVYIFSESQLTVGEKVDVYIEKADEYDLYGVTKL